MSEPFCEKLDFVLKALSISRARLAADLEVDKSVVGRWLSGASSPSPHNLSKLNAFLAVKAPGFSGLDWDRDLKNLAARLGLDGLPPAAAAAAGLVTGLPLLFLDEILAATRRRGVVYEGFYRSTRPYSTRPGQFLHDNCLVRRHPNGLLRLVMVTGGVMVEGWVLLLHDKLFIIAAETNSGAVVFGALHGVNTERAEALDGITLSPVLDVGRTLAATPIALERVAEISDDVAADEARVRAMGAVDPTAPEGSVPAAMRAHLIREMGDSQLALGGDWVLRSPLGRAPSSLAGER